MNKKIFLYLAIFGSISVQAHTFLDAEVVAGTGWGRTPCRENKETKFVLKVL